MLDEAPISNSPEIARGTAGDRVQFIVRDVGARIGYNFPGPAISVLNQRLLRITEGEPDSPDIVAGRGVDALQFVLPLPHIRTGYNLPRCASPLWKGWRVTGGQKIA